MNVEVVNMRRHGPRPLYANRFRNVKPTTIGCAFTTPASSCSPIERVHSGVVTLAHLEPPRRLVDKDDAHSGDRRRMQHIQKLRRYSMRPPKPSKVVFITNSGMRVPVELRYAGFPEAVHTWEPVIEGDLPTIMANVVAIDADHWPAGAALQLPAGPGYDTVEWGLAVLENSPVLAGYLCGWDATFK